MKTDILLNLTAAQAEAVTPAIRGRLTLQQCVDQGQHGLLIRAEVYHSHRPSAEELRAEAKRIREWKRDPDEAHYICRHGRDLGHPYGPDYMCGECESYGQDEEADQLEQLAAEQERGS